MNKKVLFLLTRFPYPPVDGSRFKVLNNTIFGLKQDYDVEFCFVTHEKYTNNQIEYLEKNFGKVNLFFISKLKYCLNIIKTFFGRKPLQTGIYFDKKALLWFKNNIKNYDAVYVHMLRLGEYSESLDDTERKKLVIDFTDAISLNYIDTKKYTNFFWSFVYSFEEKRVKNYESFLINNFYNFNIISVRDKNHILNSLKNNKNEIKFSNINLGISDKILDFSYKGLNSGLIFIGNLKYRPNLDGIDYFCSEIFPKIREEIPRITFTVIGTGEEKLKKKFPNVKFTGFIENPYEIIIQNKIFISPIRFGAGMMTKVLEAMAMKMPIIASQTSSMGIPETKDGENILIRDTNDISGWIEAVKLLLNDQQFATKIGENANKVITEKYLNSQAQEEFRKLFKEVISE